MNTTKLILTRSLARAPVAWIIPIALILAGGPLGAAHEPDEEPPEVAAKPLPIAEIKQKITVPEYVSPLQSYKKYVESGEPDWKAANGLVGEIGGWRAYAKEAFLEERKEREARKKAMEQESEESKSESAAGEKLWKEVTVPPGETE